MTKREVRKAAKTSITEGKSKQETFEELKETSKMDSEDLAKIIQSIPSPEARQKYKSFQVVMIVLLSISILAKMLVGIPVVIENGIQFAPIIFLIPLINLSSESKFRIELRL